MHRRANISNIIPVIMALMFTFSCGDNSTGPSDQSPPKAEPVWPFDGASSVLVTTDLTWKVASESDGCIFDIFFGLQDSMSLLCSDSEECVISPGCLDYATTYQWRVDTKSSGSQCTEGDPWSFTTVPQPVPGTLVQLTTGGGDETSPAWSPDGSRIAYCKDGYIWTMRSDGGEATRITSPSAASNGDASAKITSHFANDITPCWSPAGTRLAFGSSRNGNHDIFTIPAGGGMVTQVTTDPGTDMHPSWSPDGVTIAFDSERNGRHPDIFTIPADGGIATQITTAPDCDRDPCWSPDGLMLIYNGNPGNGQYDIMTIPATGGSPTQHTDTRFFEQAASISPDGNTVAFDSAPGNSSSIYLLDLDNDDVQRITADEGDDLSPSWSPDGTRIAFASNRGGGYDIWVIYR